MTFLRTSVRCEAYPVLVMLLSWDDTLSLLLRDIARRTRRLVSKTCIVELKLTHRILARSGRGTRLGAQAIKQRLRELVKIHYIHIQHLERLYKKHGYIQEDNTTTE